MPESDVVEILENQASSRGPSVDDVGAVAAQTVKTFQSGVNGFQRADSFEKQGICHFGLAGTILFVSFGLLRSILISAVNMIERKEKAATKKMLEDEIERELGLIKQVRDQLDSKESLKKRKQQINQIALDDDQKRLLNWLYAEERKKLRQYFPDVQFSIEIPVLFSDFDDNQKRILRDRLFNAMRTRNEIWFSRIVICAFIINTLVYSLFAANSAYSFVLFCALHCGTGGISTLVGAIILAAVVFSGSAITSQFAVSGSISKDCRRLCDFLQSEKKLSAIHGVYGFVAVCAIATGPLLYVTLTKLLVMLHITASAVSPLAMGIVIPLIVITVLYAIRLVWSQVKMINEKFRQQLGPQSDVYKQYEAEGRVWLYWLGVALGVAIISAVIATGVMGDVFGISKILPPHWSVLASVGIMSCVCNILLNADFVHRMPEYAWKIGKAIGGLFSKKATPEQAVTQDLDLDSSSPDEEESPAPKTLGEADRVTLFTSSSLPLKSGGAALTNLATP